MKKSIICIAYFIFSLITANTTFSQTEKFDICSYTPPKNWTKDIKNSYVSYITVDQNAGRFCLIVLYAAVPGSGSPEDDFKKEWNDLAIKPYNAMASPKTEIRTNADGWKVVAGASAVQKESVSSYIILSVFSGYDKTVSVLANLNDQAYIEEIDKFLENLKPNKTASLANTTGTNDPTTVTNNKNESSGKFGQLIYKTPEGWKTTSYQKGVVLSPSDLPAGEFLNIQIMQPMNFSGTMEQALEKSYNETCTILTVTPMREVSGKPYNTQDAKRSFKGWEYIRCSGGIHVNNGTPYPDEYGLDLFVIKVNNRFEQIAIIKSRNTCGGLSRYYPSDRLNYRNAIEDFLFSLQFEDWKEPVVKTGTAKDDGITGVWQGLGLSVGPSGAALKDQQLILFSNGQGYYGRYFPSQGLDELNTWIAAENNRREWGTYTFSNGKGILKMPYGEIPMRMEGNKLIITTNKADHGFIKSNSVDGARFKGTYVMSEAYGMTPMIIFTSDGKFIDKGAIRVLCHENTECVNAGIPHGSGTYEAKNHSLILSYTDGRKVKIAFPGTGFEKNNSSPSTLVFSFNRDVLKKQ